MLKNTPITAAFITISAIHCRFSPEKITLKGTEVLPRLPEDRLFIVSLTSEVLQCVNEEELRDLISFIIMRTNSKCKGLLALAQAVNLLEGYDKTFDV